MTTTQKPGLADKVANARTVDPAKRTVLDLLTDPAMQHQFELALPRHVSAARFVRVALTTLRLNPKLLECSRESILGGFMLAAQLGLEVSDVRGQCYLIPRRNTKAGTVEATFQLGYRGMIDLAGRGGITVEPREVREGDRFDWQYGTDAVLVHRPALDDRGDVVAFYAVAHFPDGRRPAFDVMSRAEMETHRDRFRADSRKDSAWDSHFEAMGRKTMVRRLLNYLPLPIELAQAVDAEDRTVIADPLVGVEMRIVERTPDDEGAVAVESGAGE